MIRFQNILWILYFIVAIFSYSYLRRSYFMHQPLLIEKIISIILAITWLVSVPTTWIVKSSSNEDEFTLPMSIDGFTGSEN